MEPTDLSPSQLYYVSDSAYYALSGNPSLSGASSSAVNNATSQEKEPEGRSEQIMVSTVSSSEDTPLTNTTVSRIVSEEQKELATDSDVIVNQTLVYRSNTSLHWDVWEDSRKLVELLLEYGSSVNVQSIDKNGNTLLHWAT